MREFCFIYFRGGVPPPRPQPSNSAPLSLSFWGQGLPGFPGCSSYAAEKIPTRTEKKCSNLRRRVKTPQVKFVVCCKRKRKREREREKRESRRRPGSDCHNTEEVSTAQWVCQDISTVQAMSPSPRQGVQTPP